MPCCCQTNLQATFVLGILGLVFGCLACIFQNYAGLIGIVASICFIVGAKAPNPTAILVGIVLACIQCVGMIIMAILAIVWAGALATSTSADVNSILGDGDVSQNNLQGLTYQDIKNVAWAMVIVGVVYTVGVILFQIWTIIVANKARKEIDQGIKI